MVVVVVVFLASSSDIMSIITFSSVSSPFHRFFFHLLPSPSPAATKKGVDLPASPGVVYSQLSGEPWHPGPTPRSFQP